MNPMIKQTIIYFLGCLMIVNLLVAQDEGFSNYRMAALAQNPAEAGRIDNGSQLTVLYRNQWNAAFRGYQSGYFAYEHQLFCPAESYFGLGISAAYERAGTSRFERINGNVSLAYHQKLGYGLFLAAGAEVGLIDYGLNEERLRFDRQFDGVGFDPDLPNFEDFDNRNTIKVDAAAGLLLYEQNGKWAIGASINHLLSPFISLLDNEGFNIPLSATFYGNIAIPLRNSEVSLHAMYRNYGLIDNQQSFIILGVGPVIPIGKYDNLHLDVSTRIARKDASGVVGDAIIVSANFFLDGWQLGITYDLNVSPLSSATKTFGALEGSIIIPINRESTCVRCPRLNRPN